MLKYVRLHENIMNYVAFVLISDNLRFITLKLANYGRSCLKNCQWQHRGYKKQQDSGPSRFLNTMWAKGRKQNARPKLQKTIGAKKHRNIVGQSRKSNRRLLMTGGLRLPFTTWCRRRRPPPCGDSLCSHLQFFLLWPSHVSSASGPYCFFGFGSAMCSPAFGPHCISMHLFYQPGQKTATSSRNT